MPIYEYCCGKCNKVIDLLQKVDDPPPKKCEACGAKGKMSKVVSRSSFVLKGGGWYSDLYGSKKKDSTSTSASTEPAKGATASPGDSSKAAAASTSSPAPAAGASTSSVSAASKVASDKK